MTLGRVFLLLCLALFVSACDNDSVASKGSVAKEQEPSAEAEGVFDPMVSTLDRARAVQGMQDERSADIDAATEAAGP